MKLTMKVADNAINYWFGGGCPICNGNRTLTCGGNIFNQISKRYVECNNCGSKFKASFGVVLPNYKLISGNSEYLEKELELSDWKKIRKVEIDDIEVENRNEINVETAKKKEPVEAISCCLFLFLMGAFLTIVSGILALYMPGIKSNSSYDPVMGLARWTILCAGILFVLNIMNRFISDKLFEKKEKIRLIERSKIAAVNSVFAITLIIFMILSIILSLSLSWILVGLLFFWIIPYMVLIFFHSVFKFKSDLVKHLINIMTSGFPFFLTFISSLGFILDEHNPIPLNAHDFRNALGIVTIFVVIAAILFIIAYPFSRFFRNRFFSKKSL